MLNKKRTIFIGDVHGCYDELKLLLKKLDINEIDEVYFVGDLINKGPKSYKVLKLVYKNRQQFKCIKGNHEDGFLNWLKGDTEQKGNSNIPTKLKEKIEKKEAKYLIDFMEEMPLYIEKDNFIILHGGKIPGKEISDHTANEITKLRYIDGKPWYELYKGNKKIIYGHWALDGLQIREKTIGLDSGCVYGKSLTAYILETGEIFSEQALDIYINLYK